MTNMRRKLVAGILVVLAVVSTLVGCGQSVAKEVDPQQLADRLVSEITYQQKPELMPEDELGFYMEIPEGVTNIFYMSSGDTAEEVLVITAPSEEAAITMKANVEHFLKEQADSFAKYVPETVTRIEDAVLVQKGVYVVLCVSDESQKAETIIKEVFGE